MESGIASKALKVVWLCHLNNKFISDKLGFKESFEFAPWIGRFAEIFEGKEYIEIHIVAPHKQLIRKRYIRQNNIHYHFFPYVVPGVPKRLFNKLHLITNYKWLKQQIKNITLSIKPDIVHLWGTENAYYSSSIFQFKDKYPVLISIQGLVNFVLSDSNKGLEVRKTIENEIIKSFDNFGVRDEVMKSYIKSLNPGAVYYHHEIAPYLPKLSVTVDIEKEYDIAYFARIERTKGIEDLIKAVYIVKKRMPDVSVVIIGSSDQSYLVYLKQMAANLKLINNIVFLGAIDTIDEVHELASKAMINVLPTHADTIPGTILESMYMGIPCISYPVGGIPTLNIAEEAIKLVEKGNIEKLAIEILELLNNKSECKRIALNAKRVINQRWGEDILFQSLLKAYNKVLGNE